MRARGDSRTKTEDAAFAANEILIALRSVDLKQFKQLRADLRRLPHRALRPLAEALDVLRCRQNVEERK